MYWKFLTSAGERRVKVKEKEMLAENKAKHKYYFLFKDNIL